MDTVWATPDTATDTVWATPDTDTDTVWDTVATTDTVWATPDTDTDMVWATPDTEATDTATDTAADTATTVKQSFKLNDFQSSLSQNSYQFVFRELLTAMLNLNYKNQKMNKF